MKILVAEDNPNANQLLQDIVESMGYDTLVAYDGPSALTLADAAQPDLIILDVNMPGMSGFQVCAQLKQEARTADIPVLMLTAQADVESRVTGLGLGAEDYLTKPYSPAELMARVKTRLRAKTESDHLRQTQEVVRQTFERFVSPMVVQRLLEDPSQVQLGGKLQDVTVLFSDLEGFTGVSERSEPEQLLSVLNQYHAHVVQAIVAYGGTVNKFIGDGVMALYNTPLPQAQHALQAVRTACEIRATLASFVERFPAAYRMRINFGIHSGQAVVGNVGTAQLMEFTAVGDTVNLAARLQQLSDGGQIIISEATWQQLDGKVQTQPIGLRAVKGRAELVMLYAVAE